MHGKLTLGLISAFCGLGLSVGAEAADKVTFGTNWLAEAEHGGYYHGTTVYEEQVRVPLIVLAPGLVAHRVEQPVQLVDLLPTVLRALDIPRSPRIRGNDLGPWLAGQCEGKGMALSESDDQLMLASGSSRLICERRADACALFDVSKDPSEAHNLAAPQIEQLQNMRKQLRELTASHGRYELSGAREEGKALPAALRRGLAGDTDAAIDVAALLDDADVVLRRKAAEVLFNLHSPDSAAALRLALARDEDDLTKRWCALTLTRLGQGAPRTRELLQDPDPDWSRLAALALAESGDTSGESILVAWWNAGAIGYERAREIIAALGHIRCTAAVVPLTRSLTDVRLRPHIAAALAEIGDPYGRIALTNQLPNERYETSRRALTEALVRLGASREMAPALGRFLGVPDPLVGGVDLASRAHILEALGGPTAKALPMLQQAGPDGLQLQVVIPKGGNGCGIRWIVRARSRDGLPAQIQMGRLMSPLSAHGPAVSKLDPARTVSLLFDSTTWQERYVLVPKPFELIPATLLEIVVTVARNAEISGFVLVPLADEIPPLPPEPWTPRAGEQAPDPTP